VGEPNPSYGVAALAAAEAFAHYGRGNLDATIAYSGLADAFRRLAETEDTLAEALRVGLEECERLRTERDALRATLDRAARWLRRWQHWEECPCAEHENCGPRYGVAWSCHEELAPEECQAQQGNCTCGLDATLAALEAP